MNRDGSDETTENCIATTCQKYAFRCMYGACVSGNAECNQKIECIGKNRQINVKKITNIYYKASIYFI